MYHARDGLYFDRLADGTVRCVKRDPTCGIRPVIDINIDPATWVSVVAAVSKSGETSETVQAAQELHNWTPCS